MVFIQRKYSGDHTHLSGHAVASCFNEELVGS